jgi:hypothetical protein
MIVTLIVAILATLVIGAYTSSMQLGKVARTRSQMAKIDSLLAPIWESYRTRRVSAAQLRQYSGVDPTAMTSKDIAEARLAILREQQRFELPDRVSDLLVARGRDAKTLPPRTQLYLKMAQEVAPQWLSPPPNPTAIALSRKHQGAECLYLILANIQENDTNGLEFFRETEMEDTDGDGMKEILDGWGRPIEFLRWAPGFESDKQKINDPIWIDENPDPFDPLGLDTKSGLNADKETYYLYPLVFSAGPDGKYHIATDIRDMESGTGGMGWLNYDAVENNPYAVFNEVRLGQAFDERYGYVDNIHNHVVRVRMQ